MDLDIRYEVVQYYLMNSKMRNLTLRSTVVAYELRESLNGHRGAVLWFNGLAGSGKSMVYNAVKKRLHECGYRTFMLHRNNNFHGLCKYLGLSHEDRTENIRRIGEVAKLFFDVEVVVLAAFVLPYRSDR